MGKLFWELYFSGASIAIICGKLGIGKPLLREAYPNLDFGKRGSIKPKFMGAARWKLRRSFKKKSDWKSFLAKENAVLRHPSRKGVRAQRMRHIRQTFLPKDWIVEVEDLYAKDIQEAA